MASYRYPRHMRSYRRGSMPRAGQVALALGVAAMLAGAGHTVTARAGTHHHGAPARSAAVVQAISYARAQLGKPYCYGGTGPSCYDCSGLIEQAYASAGVDIARTSEEQWATLPHVAKPRPGDLAFFVGSPIDPPPGHVVLYIGHGKVIQAYATGYPVMVSTLASLASSGFVGFARPGGA